MSERPKRSVRKPARLLDEISTEPTASSSSSTPSLKRKTQEVNRLDHLLHNPKSALTTMDISDLVNANTWDMLSDESKGLLATLLPPTAFQDFIASIDPHHPSCSTKQDVLQSSLFHHALNPSFFTDSHFLAAARTFQDHIYSGWCTDSHLAKVKQFQDGVRDGTLAAAWKDEVWEENNAEENEATQSSSQLSSDRAGETTQIKLADLAKNSIVQVGDIIAYRRVFPALNLTVEKDVLIHSIHPRNFSLTVLLESGTQQHLPPYLLMPPLPPPEPEAPTQIMDGLTNPGMLETGVLDSDGRVERSKRPNGNAWKSFTVWRWRDGGDSAGLMGMTTDERGGRENHGTLFYLRGSFQQ